MSGLLTYVPGNTLLHRMDPRTKLILPLLLCIGCCVTSSPFYLLGILLLDLLIGFIGGIPDRAFRMLKGLIKLSIFLFVLQVLFIQSGNAYFTLPLGLRVTDNGVRTGLMGVLRLMCITMPLALMLSLTQMSDLSNALVSRWHVPYKYAFAITSAIRFIPVFAGDMQAIMEAQTARGVAFDTRNFFKKVALIVPLCVPLLISSVQKIESASMAVELRGFNLRKRDSGYRTVQFQLRDILALLIGIGIVVLGFLT